MIQRASGHTGTSRSGKTNASGLLKELGARLFTTSNFAKAAIMFQGGIGTTQIALELRHRTKDLWPDSSVFWVLAISFNSVQEAHYQIGTHPKFPGLDQDKVAVFNLVRQCLSRASAGRWLLVLDNADNLDVCFTPKIESGRFVRLADYLPCSPLGSVLVTARGKESGGTHVSQYHYGSR
jgi:hypothetical protein